MTPPPSVPRTMATANGLARLSPPKVAVILAAGEGKRMRPLTANRPKVLLPVAGVPLAERLVRQVALSGIREVVLVVNYKEDAVRAHFGDGSAFGVRIRYARQEATRGTGDAVLAANVDSDALILNGDLLLSDDAIPRILAAGPFVLSSFRVKDARAYGVFGVREGRVVAIIEKSPSPPSDLANAGVYRFPASFFKHLRDLKPSPRGELEITDAVNAFLATGERATLVDLPRWLDVGRPWDILGATEAVLKEMKGEIHGTVEPGCTLKGEVYVARGALLRAGTYVEGPVWIGEDAILGPNCYVRANTAIGRKCRVGNACEVKASVLMDGTHVGHLSYVGDSVLGERVNFGAGTIVANLRHDNQTVKVGWEGERHDTGRRKMGVIVGDDVHTGINSTLNLGVVLKSGATTKPGEVVMRTPE